VRELDVDSFLSRIVGVEERHVDHLLALEIRDA
jgi:hypothetical protein